MDFQLCLMVTSNQNAMGVVNELGRKESQTFILFITLNVLQTKLNITMWLHRLTPKDTNVLLHSLSEISNVPYCIIQKSQALIFLKNEYFLCSIKLNLGVLVLIT